MNIHWKIFNIVNLICLTLIARFLAWPLFTYSLNNFKDKLFFTIVMITILVVVINCLHNIFLTKKLAMQGNLRLTRKIFFWVFFILFSTIISIVVYNTPETLRFYFKNRNTLGETFRLRQSILILSISVTGLYIMV